MIYLLIALHIITCIALIIVVLLQSGKGAEIGATFGAGASNTVFGASGGKTFMSQLTTAAAVIFMLTSLTLAYFYEQPGSESVMPSSVPAAAAKAPVQKAPALPTAPAAKPAQQAPAPVQKK